jgi:hypothetical protein
MKLELPLMTYATQLSITYAGPCEQFYTQSYLLSTTQATALCQNSTFSFEDPFLTAFANLNMFLYADVYNPQYQQMFVEITGATTA